MANDELTTVLAVGFGEAPGNEAAASITQAGSGREALELIRLVHFDLLVTASSLPDMPPCTLMRRVKAAWPWQKWAWVAAAITPSDEVTARMLGVTAIVDEPADWEQLVELARRLRCAEQSRRPAVAMARSSRSGGGRRPLQTAGDNRS